MNGMWKAMVLTALFTFHHSLFTAVLAQEDPEYRMEIGGGIGMANYLGDLNGNLTRNLQPAFSAVTKYRFNPRNAMAFSLTYSTLKGKAADAGTWYVQQPLKDFSHTLIDGGFRYEYNFWAYGTGREYHGAKKLSPFIAFGLGLTYANATTTVIAANVPLAFGVKYKIGERLNLTGEWAMHFSGTDALDAVKDPYDIKSTGLFKNTDCYSQLRITLTYDFLAKCKVCHNESE